MIWCEFEETGLMQMGLNESKTRKDDTFHWFPTHDRLASNP